MIVILTRFSITLWRYQIAQFVCKCRLMTSQSAIQNAVISHGCEKYLFDSSRWLLCCIVKLNGVQITPRSYTESRSMMMWLWLLNDARNFVILSLISVFDANIVSNIIINYLCKLITSSQVEPANKSSICNQFNRLARAHTFFSFCVLCWNIVNEWE